jgi:hypothetical protein
MFAVASSAALSLLKHVPYPHITDEYSYLLAADTFASGRLSNPPHPLWIHFESFNILQQPTYASKYPPAQGLILAFGQIIGGHPIVGVWLSMGLAYAATYWMLLAWVPARWALPGTLVATWHPGILIEWGWSYWGGAVAMAGGALVFGAMMRIVRQPRALYAILLGIGIAVLANSRPFEGLVVCLPVAVVLFHWIVSNRHSLLRVSFGRIGLPILAILILTGTAMAYYNFRVSGNPLQIPYLLHQKTYSVAPAFIWQSPSPEPTYHHRVIRDVVLGWEFDGYAKQQSIRGLARTISQKGGLLWRFYQGMIDFRIVLTIPLIVALGTLKAPRMRFPLLTCSILALGLLTESWLFSHYAAPITSLLFLIVLQGLRHLRVWRWRGRRLGQSVVWVFVAVALSSFMFDSVKKLQPMQQRGFFERARIIEQLESNGGRHLVIVRYGPRQKLNLWEYNWVYNRADIDGASVVWAHEMDSAQNRKLLEYFQERQAWLFDVDQQNSSPKLVPYPIELAPK